MSTLSLPVLSRAPVGLAPKVGSLAFAIGAVWARFREARELSEQRALEQRFVAALAANGGLLTDELERRLMSGDRR